MHSTAKARSLFFLPALFHFRSKMSNSSTRSKKSGFARVSSTETVPRGASLLETPLASWKNTVVKHDAIGHFCRIGSGIGVMIRYGMHFQTKKTKSERF